MCNGETIDLIPFKKHSLNHSCGYITILNHTSHSVEPETSTNNYSGKWTTVTIKLREEEKEYIEECRKQYNKENNEDITLSAFGRVIMLNNSKDFINTKFEIL